MRSAQEDFEGTTFSNRACLSFKLMKDIGARKTSGVQKLRKRRRGREREGGRGRALERDESFGGAFPHSAAIGASF